VIVDRQFGMKPGNLRMLEGDIATERPPDTERTGTIEQSPLQAAGLLPGYLNRHLGTLVEERSLIDEAEARARSA
jgi:hypothetical protein